MRRACRSGVTLLEVTIASLLVGILLVAALNVLAASTRTGLSAQQQATADLFAHQLLSKLVSTDYEHVHESDHWTESSRQYRDGTMIEMGPLQRTVAVEFVHPDDLDHVIGEDLGVKRVTVTVRRTGAEQVLAEAVGIHAASWPKSMNDLHENWTTHQPANLNYTPEASISASVAHGPSPLTIQFHATESFDQDGDELTYAWDFGDGQLSASTSPAHTFINTSAANVSFRVKLLVTDRLGASHVDYKSIVVTSDR